MRLLRQVLRHEHIEYACFSIAQLVQGSVSQRLLILDTLNQTALPLPWLGKTPLLPFRLLDFFSVTMLIVSQGVL